MKKIRILYVYRKNNKTYLSIEKIFNAIQDNLPGEYDQQRMELPFATGNILSIIRNLWLIRNLNAEIYHVTGDVHYAVLALPSRKTILTIHDNVFLYRYKGLKRWVLKKIFLDWPVHYVDRVTAVSEKTKNELIHFTGVSPDKVRVVPNPILLPDIRSADKVPGLPRLLFIGSTPNKNLERVLEALVDLPCILHLLGQYPEDVFVDMRNRKITYELHFCLSEEELAKLYHSTDILIYPSLYEGFGLPILEAQKAGVPVLTSDLSPMSEIAGGGALLVDPLDVESIRRGVISLLEDESIRHELIHKGYSNISKYSLQSILGQYCDIYGEIVSRNRQN